jgi:hypothetical protein
MVHYHHGHVERGYLSGPRPSTFLKGAVPHRGKRGSQCLILLSCLLPTAIVDAAERKL